MGCRSSKSVTRLESRRASVKADIGKTEVHLNAVGLDPTRTPLADTHDVNQPTTINSADRTIKFSGDQLSESGERYQGQLNARLAALILQKRAVRDAARGSNGAEPRTRIRSYGGSGDTTPVVSPASSRRNSGMSDSAQSCQSLSKGKWFKGEPAPIVRETATSRVLSEKRNSKVKFNEVIIHEFTRDWSCAAAQPSSGGPALGMGVNCIKLTHTPLDDFENERMYTRTPCERFHITGRMSPLERSRLLDVRKKT